MNKDLHLEKCLEPACAEFVPPSTSPLPPRSLELTAAQRQKIIRGFVEVESVQKEIVEQSAILPEHQMYLLNSVVGMLQLLVLANRNVGTKETTEAQKHRGT